MTWSERGRRFQNEGVSCSLCFLSSVMGWLKRFSPLITALATALIAIWTYQYTTYSKAQWEEMKSGAKQTQDNFVRAQRAFVNLGSSDGKTMRLLPLKAGHPILVALYLQNSGHLPAS